MFRLSALFLVFSLMFIPSSALTSEDIAINSFRSVNHGKLRSNLVYSKTPEGNKIAYIVTPSKKDGNIQSILKANITPVAFIPGNSYIVLLSPAEKDDLVKSGKIRKIELYQPQHRLVPTLIDLLDNIDKVSDWICFRAVFFKNTDTRRIKHKVLNSFGGTIAGKGRKLRLSFPPETIEKALIFLAFQPETEFIELCGTPSPSNNNSAWVCQSFNYEENSVPIWTNGISGDGEIIAIADTGLDADMCYFYDSTEGLPSSTVNNNNRKVISYHYWSTLHNWDEDRHGTHVAGTAAGNNTSDNGSFFPYYPEHDHGDGMAPGAKLVIQDVGNSSAFEIPDDLYDLFDEAYSDGARIHNNSWNDSDTSYTGWSCDIDEFIWNNPDMTIVFSAGNSGPCYSTNGVTSPSTAKNCITVGATDHGSLDPESVMCWSGNGPTDDGRIKPTVTAPGNKVISANTDTNIDSFNCSTRIINGTSMSAPTVAGLTALVNEYFRKGFYPSGTKVSADAFNPPASLSKAILVNSAQNMTGAYTAGDGSTASASAPAMGQGWGRVLLNNALYFSGNERKLWISTGKELSAGENHDFYIPVGTGSEPLKITLCWSDYPGTPVVTPNIVNNLDLTLTAPDFSVYYGNNFSNGQSVSGGSSDNLNVIEGILINTPATGIYKLSVKGSEVPIGPQPYALVVTGAIDFSSTTVEMDKAVYNCSSTINIVLRDDDLSGTGTASAEISSTTEGTPEVLTFTENPLNSGIFRTSITTSTGTPAVDSVLQVSDGDIITVSTIDSVDASGNTNVTVENTASVDCITPIISSVAVSEISENSALISWTTDEKATSNVHYDTATPPSSLSTNPGSRTSHSVILTGLSSCTLYYFSVSSEDTAGNTVTDDNGGSYYSFSTLSRNYHFIETFDNNPSWTTSGDWEFGSPSSSGGTYYGNSDPSSAYSGNFVYGNDLTGDGDYEDNAVNYYLESPSLNLTGISGVHLEFYRFLNIETVSYDQATVEVYKDTGWNVVWRNPKAISDSSWNLIDIDISDYADNNADCRIRWNLNSDAGVSYSGWNIDDVGIYSLHNCSAGTVYLDRSSYSCDDIIGITVNDGDLNNNPGITETVTVNIDSTTESTAEPVVLSENGTDSYEFSGSINTASGTASPDGLLQLSEGDTVTVTYLDSDDGTGSSATVTDSASGNCSPLTEYFSHSIDDSLYDNNGLMNPGETVIVAVTIKNSGNAPATAITATLSSTETGVTINDNSASYQDIAPAASQQSDAPHFEVQLSSSFPCGSYIEFSLNISCNEGTFQDSFKIKVDGSSPLTSEQGGSGEGQVSTRAVTGNVYSVNTNTIIEEFQCYLNISESTDLVFLVYEGTSLTGNYNRIYQHTVPSQGPGEGYYSSGTVYIPVSSGKYYFIGLTWLSETVSYGWGNSLPPDTSFGKLETMKIADYPPGDILVQDELAGNLGFRQKIISNSQCDVWNTVPNANFYINSYPLCTATAIEFIDSSEGSPVDWEWDFDNNSVIDSTFQNPLYSYSSSGSYTVTLIASDSDGSGTISQNIVIHETPLPSFTSNTPVQQGQPLSFTNSSSGGVTPYTFSWDFGDGNGSSATNPVHTYSNAGTYTVTLSVSDYKGCGNLTSSPVQITASPLLQYYSYTLDDSGGNNNGFADKGESFGLSLSLKNSGLSTATTVSAVLSSSTSGVTITSGNSPYNDIAPAAVEQSIAQYTISLDQTVSCGTIIDFSLSITSDQANWTDIFSLSVYTDFTEPVKVAIFQDHDPWGFTPNQDVLVKAGIDFDFYHSADMGVIDLSPYHMIISSSQQERRYYENIAANREWFEQWIAKGGVFKWIGYTFAAEDYSDLVMPGNWSCSYGFSDSLAIADSSHILFHEPNTVVATDLRIASGYISSSPTGAHTLVTDNKTNPGQPVTQEWDFGKGKVLVTMEGLEADWYNGKTALHENFILYNPQSGYCDSVSNAPEASFMIFSSPQCGNTPIYFTDTSTGLPQNWSWDFDGDGLEDSSSQNPVYTYSSHGTYTVTLAVTDNDGSSSSTETVVIDLPAPLFSDNSPLTVGERANFTSTVTAGTTPYSYSWDFGDNSGSSTSPNPLYTYTATGTYSVILSVSDGQNCTNTFSANFVVTDNPGEVPDGDDIQGTMLTAGKSGNDVLLSWGNALNSSDYVVYRGTISGLYDHTTELTGCGAGGTSYSDTNSLLSLENYYYIAVGTGNGFEGDYGDDSNNIQRPSADELSASSCFPQWR